MVATFDKHDVVVSNSGIVCVRKFGVAFLAPIVLVPIIPRPKHCCHKGESLLKERCRDDSRFSKKNEIKNPLWSTK